MSEQEKYEAIIYTHITNNNIKNNYIDDLSPLLNMVDNPIVISMPTLDNHIISYEICGCDKILNQSLINNILKIEMRKIFRKKENNDNMSNRIVRKISYDKDALIYFIFDIDI